VAPPERHEAEDMHSPPVPDSGRKSSAALPPLRALRSDADVARIAEALKPIEARARQCIACHLHETRQQVVFARGSARSGIVFVGEAPGAQEDAKGFPFVGAAGQLLDRILVALGVARDDVYVCNVLKCRPPNNREPQPLEVATCAPFLREQIAAVEPIVICALGLHAARWLLATNLPMSRLRGQILTYQGVPTIATYHPAALLRNPNLKRETWEDVQILRRLVEERMPA
jgi:DNA polymerase